MSFFTSKEELHDPFYAAVYNQKSRILKDAHDFIEDLWHKYAPYAEPNFQQASTRDFHAKFWEMYLGCMLLDYGFELQKKMCTNGPDIHLVINDRHVWIEAVTPGPGTGADAVPQPEYGVSNDMPKDKIILRLTSAIKDKHDKYLKYRSDGIIQPADCYIIAVNGGRIYRCGLLEGQLPFIISSVLPFGDLVLTLDKKTSEVIDSSFKYRDAVMKSNNKPIMTTFFEDKAFSGITAVLYSAINALWCPQHIGEEVEFVHNPLATNKLPLETFRFGREWWVEGESLNGREWHLKNGDHD